MVRLVLSCYHPRHERPGKRCAAPRRTLIAAAENAPPIARRAGRSRAAREGEEAYSDSREARQRKKAWRRCLTVLGLVRLSIQEPLALCIRQQGGCPFPVVHIAGIGSKIEL